MLSEQIHILYIHSKYVLHIYKDCILKSNIKLKNKFKIICSKNNYDS